MRAMILAAGRGERLRPLTDATPKPLLTVGEEPLIVRTVRQLTAAGFAPLVINLHHLGEKIRVVLGDGGAFDTTIHYSPETDLLAAAGGIRQAIACDFLPEPFALVNGDIYTDYDFRRLHNAPKNGAHLVLVDNPPHNPSGDFSLSGGDLRRDENRPFSYAGIGVFAPSLFAHLPSGRPHAMLPILQQAIADGRGGGEYHAGVWYDIGTPAALAAARGAQQPTPTDRARRDE